MKKLKKEYTQQDMMNYQAFNEFEGPFLKGLKSHERLKEFKQWNKQ